jgi:hypothetical protein
MAKDSVQYVPSDGQEGLDFSLSEAELATRMLKRRAVEAAIWGMPLVSVDAMRHAYFRDAGARYHDVLFWSKPSDWRLQFTTPNASTYYVYIAYNLKAGPVVLEIPAEAGAGLFGSIVDAWQLPMIDVGAAGEDGGKGGKYLLVPPGFQGSIPRGYFTVYSETFNGYCLLRAIPVSSSDTDVARAIALIKRLRVYPLSKEESAEPQCYIDMAGKLLDGVVAFDESFYVRLARMVEEEPVQARDLVAMGQLRSIGIAKDLRYEQKESTKAVLASAAREVHAAFMLAVRGGVGWWPGSAWKLPEDKGAKTGFGFLTESTLFLDERGLIFFLAFAAPKKLGAATFYLVGASDADGDPLCGERSYVLHVPPSVPAKQYWAATVYDLETACFLRNMPRPGVDSFDQNLRVNPDGSIDLFFGPEAPTGKEQNWIPTERGRPWFSMFRFYGPERPLFDKTWLLPDICLLP